MKFFRSIYQKLLFKLTGELLCDTCTYDYREICKRPERPNAKVCPDYKRK